MHDLRERRHDDRPAELLAHPTQLLDHGAFEMRHAMLGQMAPHGADHAAGQLMLQVAGVERLRLADRQTLRLGQAA